MIGQNHIIQIQQVDLASSEEPGGREPLAGMKTRKGSRVMGKRQHSAQTAKTVA